jgi:hypothetical protein
MLRIGWRRLAGKVHFALPADKVHLALLAGRDHIVLRLQTLEKNVRSRAADGVRGAWHHRVRPQRCGWRSPLRIRFTRRNAAVPVGPHVVVQAALRGYPPLAKR